MKGKYSDMNLTFRYDFEKKSIMVSDNYMLITKKSFKLS